MLLHQVIQDWVSMHNWQDIASYAWYHTWPLWRHRMKTFPRYWPFVRGIHRSPVNSPHKGQWSKALIGFFDLRLNKRWRRWFGMPSRSAHWTLGDLNDILNEQYSSLFQWLIADVFLVKLLMDEYHWPLPMVNQLKFRRWLCVVRLQTIAWAHVDPDLCRHMASLGYNE